MITANKQFSGKMDVMLASESMPFIWSSDWANVLGPLAALILVIFFAVLWYVREGRNSALEHVLIERDFGPPVGFRGSLVVEEHQPRSYLRLCKTTRAARRLQFQYRWLLGVGRQAIFDEVMFDGSNGLVELRRKNKHTTAAFSEFSAIRMREVAGGRGGRSLWHVELIPQKGKATPFVTSERGDRRTMFEQTAPVAKAVSAIMAIPVQVFVAGNIWTPGWPPKNAVASS